MSKDWKYWPVEACRKSVRIVVIYLLQTEPSPHNACQEVENHKERRRKTRTGGRRSATRELAGILVEEIERDFSLKTSAPAPTLFRHAICFYRAGLRRA